METTSHAMAAMSTPPVQLQESLLMTGIVLLVQFGTITRNIALGVPAVAQSW